jgi:hypothetical protein
VKDAASQSNQNANHDVSPLAAHAPPRKTPTAQQECISESGGNEFEADSRPGAFPPHQFMSLQRTIGNRAVTSLLNGGHVGQYRIGPVDDVSEREADRVADQVMRMPDPTVQRAPT